MLFPLLFTFSLIQVAISSPAQSIRRDASPEDQQAYLDAHNSVRAQHGAAALTWDSSLSDAAQSWGERCVFEHSGGAVGPFGENLFAATGSVTPAGAVKAWTDEEGDYDPSNPQPSHYTQVVWKGTQQVGCAEVTCPPGSIFDPSFGDAFFVVCEYNPPGNVIGQFPDNVQ